MNGNGNGNSPNLLSLNHFKCSLSDSLACSSLLHSCVHCCRFHWAICCEKADCLIRESITDHFYPGWHGFRECNITRQVQVSLRRLNSFVYAWKLRLVQHLVKIASYFCFIFFVVIAGSVGIANMIEKIANNEYMGFENLCTYKT